MELQGKIGDLEEYIVQGDVSQQRRAANWQIAIGLQDVDRLRNSAYLLENARAHIEGKIQIADVQKRIDEYYKTEEGRELAKDRSDEADYVATHIASVLSEDVFSLTSMEYARIHRRLFKGVFDHAGEYRKVNLSKREWVLDGDSVLYMPYEGIAETLEYDFAQERLFSYEGRSAQEAVRHVSKFISGIWEIHPFREGNTRTTAVFTILYLRKFGFRVSNEPFANNSWYFRNALVRANYTNYEKNISATTIYLERFFENLLLGANHELKNRFCHILWQEQPLDQSAKVQFQSATPKCKNCTLNETVVLQFLSSNPTATQTTIAKEIGKSVRTVKTITGNLQEKGLLVRRNGKRNGHWEVVKGV